MHHIVPKQHKSFKNISKTRRLLFKNFLRQPIKMQPNSRSLIKSTNCLQPNYVQLSIQISRHKMQHTLGNCGGTSADSFVHAYIFPLSCCQTIVQARQPTSRAVLHAMHSMLCACNYTSGELLAKPAKATQSQSCMQPWPPIYAAHCHMHRNTPATPQWPMLVSSCGTDFSWNCSHASPSQQQTSAIYMHRCPLTKLMQHSIADTRPTK